MQKLSLAKKIAFVFILVVFIQALLLSYFSYHEAVKQILSNKKADVADLVNRIDITINANVRNITSQLESLAENKKIIDFLSETKTDVSKLIVQDYLLDIVERSSIDYRLTVCDNSGMVLGQYPETEAYIQTAELKNIYVSTMAKRGNVLWLGLRNPVFASETVSNAIVLSCAVIESDTRSNLGMLVMEVDPELFGNLLLNNQNTYTNQYTFIVDQQGLVVSSNKNVDRFAIKEIYSHFDTGLRRFDFEFSDTMYYTSGQYNGLTSWVTFSMISYDSVFAQVQDLRSLILISALLVSVISSLLVIFITQSMTAPLRQLSNTMLRVHNGNFSEHIVTKRKDEVGTLVDSFNFMIKKINELINEVYREKMAQKDAELEALQLQINPHFLYNTLDSINWMAIEEGAYDVSRAIVSLGNLLHYSIDSDSALAPLSQELTYIDSYLSIQKNLLEEKLSYEIKSSLDAEHYLVPKLILQPIVENAITHGLRPKVDCGSVSIEIRLSEDEIHILVQDDGVGIEDSEVQRLLLDDRIESKRGIGLSNVDRRLRLHYGEDFGLKIQSIMGKGTLVLMRIPVILSKVSDDVDEGKYPESIEGNNENSNS